MSLGRIPVSLPFIRKKGVEVLRAEYPSSDEAAQRIPAAIRDYYRREQPATYQSRTAEVELAQRPACNLWQNVFPTFRLNGVYKANPWTHGLSWLFRCHDEARHLK
jgi:hypothetical protein